MGSSRGGGVKLNARCKCGAGPHATRDGICERGHALPGNSLALVSGEQSVQFWSAVEPARREIVREVLRDAGYDDPDDAPRSLKVAADGLAQSALLRDSSFARVIESGGPFTAAGRMRRTFTVWLSCVDRAERHARLLGLKRTPTTPETLEDLASRIVAQRDQGGAEK